MKSDILLETGTNEFEIVEFTVGPLICGINVAKVREVINPVPVTKVPQAHEATDGIISLRGRTMPLVNLARCLGVEDTEKFNIIVGELNQFYAGFKVSSVSRIHRISWKQLEPTPEVSSSHLVNGIIKMGEKLILLLDFEQIIADINPEINAKLNTVPQADQSIKSARGKKRILIAEDSHMLRELLVTTLSTSGYANLTATENGQEAWNALESTLQEPAKSYDILISDIEMPKMDGHFLTKQVKSHDKLSLPVILFSSLINEEMRRKGESIGADAQVTKPEIAKLIDILDKLLALKG